mgnify:CR=1 FL=1
MKPHSALMTVVFLVSAIGVFWLTHAPKPTTRAQARKGGGRLQAMPVATTAPALPPVAGPPGTEPAAPLPSAPVREVRILEQPNMEGPAPDLAAVSVPPVLAQAGVADGPPADIAEYPGPPRWGPEDDGRDEGGK